MEAGAAGAGPSEPYPERRPSPFDKQKGFVEFGKLACHTIGCTDGKCITRHILDEKEGTTFTDLLDGYANYRNTTEQPLEAKVVGCTLDMEESVIAYYRPAAMLPIEEMDEENGVEDPVPALGEEATPRGTVLLCATTEDGHSFFLSPHDLAHCLKMLRLKTTPR
jgi:hypothetical protein